MSQRCEARNIGPIASSKRTRCKAICTACIDLGIPEMPSLAEHVAARHSIIDHILLSPQRIAAKTKTILQISENLSLCDFPRSGTALWRERKAPAGPGTGGAQGARILRGAAPEAGTPHQGPSSRHPPAVWRRARRGLRLLGTRHVPASRHASAPGTARAPGARRGALAAPLLRQTRGEWSSWGFGGRSSLT